MHSRGKEDASGKSRAAAFPGTYPAPSPPWDIPSPRGADGGSSRGRPEHLQAMHRPGTCSAARDAAGIEPDPRNQSMWTLSPLPTTAAPSLLLEHPFALPSPTPGKTQPLLCGAGDGTPIPGQGPPPRPALTHRRGGQRLPSHQLAWPQPVEEIAELALGAQPGRGEDEPAEESKGLLRSVGLPGLKRGFFPLKSPGRGAQHWLPSPRGALRAVGAVAVGAAVSGLPAALPGDPGPHLHRDAGLRAPPNVAAQLFGTTLWKPRQGVSPGSARCSRTLLRDGRQTRWKNQSLPTRCSLPSFGTLFIVIYATFPWG